MTAAAAVDALEPMSSAEAGTYQRLRTHLATCKLGAAAEALTGVLDAARAEDLSLVSVLERLLAAEVSAVQARRHAGLLRFASLPAPYCIGDFDFTAQPGVDEKLIRELASLRFLDDAGNILLVGQPGTGKTMLAIGIARAAVDAGHRVYFTTAAETSPNAANAPPWKAAGPPRCASSPDPSCSSSTSSPTPGTTPTPRRTPPCSRSSAAATSSPAPSSPATQASPPGASASATQCSPPRCWTSSCTAASSSRSTGLPNRMRAHQQRTEQLRQAITHPEQT